MQNMDNIASQLDEWLEKGRQQRGLPSLSAAVTLDGSILWKNACGLARLDPPRPAQAEMVYPLGSISKVFVVTMLMQLVERGIVALDDSITKYLPEYQVISFSPGAPAATLRQLASHTAGLPRDAAINFPMNQSLGAWEFSGGQAPLRWYASPEQVLGSLNTVRLELPPDTAKRYSNLGIMLLGIALERACGQDFRQFISSNIFAPLDMTSAGFVDEPDAWDSRFPCGYGRSSMDGTLFSAPRWQLGSAIYTGGIYATAQDLARFSAAFMPCYGGSQPGSPILSPGSVQRMIHPEAMGDSSLGWWKGWHAGRANFGHAGAHVGFMSAALFVPELKLSVTVQTNRWNPIFDTQDSTLLARDLLSLLIPRVECSRPEFDPTAVDLYRYSGDYRLPGDFAHAAVSAGDGLLRIAFDTEAAPAAFAPVAPHSFGPPGTLFPAVSFQEDSAGNIASLEYALFRFYKQEA